MLSRIKTNFFKIIVFKTEMCDLILKGLASQNSRELWYFYGLLNKASQRFLN